MFRKLAIALENADAKRSWLPTGRLALLWGEQRPFRRRGVSLAVDASPKWWPRRQLRIEIVWGPGAGYIGGRTAFLAINCGGTAARPDHGRTGTNFHINERMQYGFTGNANSIPLVRHG